MVETLTYQLAFRNPTRSNQSKPSSTPYLQGHGDLVSRLLIVDILGNYTAYRIYQPTY